MKELQKLKNALEAAKKEISSVLVESTMSRIREMQITNANETLKTIQDEIAVAQKELQSLRSSLVAEKESHDSMIKASLNEARKLEVEAKAIASSLKSKAQDELSKAQSLLAENIKKEAALNKKMDAIKELAR